MTYNNADLLPGEADWQALAALADAGAQLGVRPRAHESPTAFAYRVAEAAKARRRRRHLVLALRISLAVALAAFGISSF